MGLETGLFCLLVSSRPAGRSEELLATHQDASQGGGGRIAICGCTGLTKTQRRIFSRRSSCGNQDLDPADTAWIMINTLECYWLWERRTKSDRAFDAQAVVVGEPPDPTISAFIGASYWLLWTTASWSDRTFVKDVIIGGDTANSCGKISVSRTLSDYLDQSFNAWVNQSRSRFSHRTLSTRGLRRQWSFLNLLETKGHSRRSSADSLAICFWAAIAKRQTPGFELAETIGRTPMR